MSPRRSSRARTTQPSPALHHTNSSSSGNSHNRGERNTRSNNKHASPQRSSTHRSQSLDDSDGKPDLPQTRQRHRAQDDDNDDLSQANDDEGDEEENDDEEITRCLCGQQEYPGLPPSRRSATGRHRQQAGGKDNTLAKDEADPLSDDIGSMFIQCDSCKVWQHGGCVGIMDEAMSPDEYFCEECRKDLHKITAESNGQHSSQYLPVAPVFSPDSSSRESSSDIARRSRDSRSRQAENPKRRSTMNSRDAAYDEEELLRRAIEESKEDSRMSNDETSSRRTKRSRSDDEVNKQAVKRPRTGSPSPPAVSKQSIPPSQPVSEDEAKPKTNGVNRAKRGASGRGQKEKEVKEPEEQQEEEETEQPGPIPRRKSRSEKKREEESDHEAEASPSKPSALAPTPSEPEPLEPTPETPVLAAEPAPPPPPPRQSTRKSGRPPARRGGRLGRNQYTRDRDLNGDAVNSPNSPHGSHFRDNGRDSPSVGGPNGLANGADGKGGKGRHLNPHRTSMNEMKRRVAAILDFISRMQVEMAASGETVTPPDNNTTNSNRTPLVKGVQDQLSSLLTSTNSEGVSVASSAGSAADDTSKEKEKDFKDLTSIEMMDVLTRHLLKWQQEYGKYGEK
ncbi:transcriptional regulator (Cti6), putative [Talaromyces stipitatus ATCC 10500]|uniref:Transcriptional regulator (Cti6), putative n=1 Tax=Talaromyces stipitatus (strain ATCC 10500 / CBS 375.48 / QM 6759 / NRRL 1006) TaxID=441959 RepID=B8MCY3_TALSN|nr:transcriptional regulator (Cti6), putative [Talaromyces stipitatus ATCC 10500]EED17509.1 transcriptional regulator (Cti6), putative [Talaromyces stipitatus ATCC 10500]